MPRSHGSQRFQSPWLLGAALPIVSMAASLLVNLDRDGGQMISRGFVSGLAADALLYSAAALVLLAPLAGVLSASPRDNPCATHRPFTVRPILVGVLAFTIVSAIVTRLALGPGTTLFVATSHATMAVVAIALAMVGAFCGVAFDDPLDAAACSLVVVVLAAAGLLVAGAWIEFVPGWFVRAAFVASPLVAMTTAAGIDLVRMDVLYRISPLAHLQIDYPAWYAMCAWYLTLAFTFSALTWKRGRTAAAS